MSRISKFPPLGLAYVAAATPLDWMVTIINETIDAFQYDPHSSLVSRPSLATSIGLIRLWQFIENVGFRLFLVESTHPWPRLRPPNISIVMLSVKQKIFGKPSLQILKPVR